MTAVEMRKCIDEAKRSLVEYSGVDKFSFAWIEGYVSALAEVNEGLSNRLDNLSEALVESMDEARKVVE